MPGRIVRQRADELEAVPLVERRSLEAVRVQRDLDAAASSCLGLRRLEQATAAASPAHVRANPERVDPARPAPAPAVDAAGQRTLAIGLDGQQLAEVPDPRRLDIERIDLVHQAPGSGALRLAQAAAAQLISLRIWCTIVSSSALGGRTTPTSRSTISSVQSCVWSRR